ncbi:hypothetical protein PR048_006930 [Dryococelus australis]|uniref:Uncharacterized protein n=1 Tax=Dryococelus australis TaxID=614101 RepID=A0ABQ9ICD0_9NEOP|nr:hypothetical protein PR048_006930 [Dryococelus australis]
MQEQLPKQTTRSSACVFNIARIAHLLLRRLDLVKNAERIFPSSEYGAVPEWRGGGNGRSPGKPADQRYRPARFPHLVTQPGIEPGSPWWEASGLTARPPRSPSCNEASVPYWYELGCTYGKDFEQCRNEVYRWPQFRHPMYFSVKRRDASFRRWQRRFNGNTRWRNTLARKRAVIVLLPKSNNDVPTTAKLDQAAAMENSDFRIWETWKSLPLAGVISVYSIFVPFHFCGDLSYIVLLQTRHELSEFERGMIVGARNMECSISEVVQNRSTVSRVYRKYQNKGIAIHCGLRSCRPKSLDNRRLGRIVRANRAGTFAQITATFDAGGVRRHDTEHNASLGLMRLLIGPWRTGNMWPGPMSHDTGCFRLMAGFGYSANPMRPWIPVVNKAPCRLPLMDFSIPDNDGTLQQDNAPYHRAADVQDWFEEQSREFQRMERDGENHSHPRSCTRDLWTAIPTAWLNISPEVFGPLMESMPRRVTALLRYSRPEHDGGIIFAFALEICAVYPPFLLLSTVSHSSHLFGLFKRPRAENFETYKSDAGTRQRTASRACEGRLVDARFVQAQGAARGMCIARDRTRGREVRSVTDRIIDTRWESADVVLKRSGDIPNAGRSTVIIQLLSCISQRWSSNGRLYAAEVKAIHGCVQKGWKSLDFLRLSGCELRITNTIVNFRKCLNASRGLDTSPLLSDLLNVVAIALHPSQQGVKKRGSNTGDTNAHAQRIIAPARKASSVSVVTLSLAATFRHARDQVFGGGGDPPLPTPLQMNALTVLSPFLLATPFLGSPSTIDSGVPGWRHSLSSPPPAEEAGRRCKNILGIRMLGATRELAKFMDDGLRHYILPRPSGQQSLAKVSMEQHRNAMAGKAGDPRKKLAGQWYRPAQFPRAKISGRRRRDSNPVRRGWDASSLITSSPRPREQRNDALARNYFVVYGSLTCGSKLCREPKQLQEPLDAYKRRVIEVNIEQRRNEGAGGTRDTREIPPTNGIVWHDSHLRKSGDPGSPWWEESVLIAQPPWQEGNPGVGMERSQTSLRWKQRGFRIATAVAGEKKIMISETTVLRNENIRSVCTAEPLAVMSDLAFKFAHLNCRLREQVNVARTLGQQEKELTALRSYDARFWLRYTTVGHYYREGEKERERGREGGERDKEGQELRVSLNIDVFRVDDEVKNARAGDTGDTRENPLTNLVVRHNSHIQKYGSEPTGNRARFTHGVKHCRVISEKAVRICKLNVPRNRREGCIFPAALNESPLATCAWHSTQESCDYVEAITFIPPSLFTDSFIRQDESYRRLSGNRSAVVLVLFCICDVFGYSRTDDSYGSALDFFGSGTSSTTDFFRHGADSTTDFFRHGADSTTDFLRHGADSTTDFFRHGADSTTDFFRHGADSTTDLFRHGADSTTDLFRHGADSTTDFFRHGADSTTDFFRHGADSTTDFFRHGADSTTDFFRHGADSTTDFFRHGADSTIELFGWPTYRSAAIDDFRPYTKDERHRHLRVDHLQQLHRHRNPSQQCQDFDACTMMKPLRKAAIRWGRWGHGVAGINGVDGVNGSMGSMRSKGSMGSLGSMGQWDRWGQWGQFCEGSVRQQELVVYFKCDHDLQVIQGHGVKVKAVCIQYGGGIHVQEHGLRNEGHARESGFIHTRIAKKNVGNTVGKAVKQHSCATTRRVEGSTAPQRPAFSVLFSVPAAWPVGTREKVASHTPPGDPETTHATCMPSSTDNTGSQHLCSPVTSHPQASGRDGKFVVASEQGHKCVRSYPDKPTPAKKGYTTPHPRKIADPGIFCYIRRHEQVSSPTACNGSSLYSSL